jgi:PAS domain S-box-containing protein
MMEASRRSRRNMTAVTLWRESALFSNAAAALGLFIAILLGHAMGGGMGKPMPVWLPAGFVVGALCRWRWRVLPGLAVVILSSAFVWPDPYSFHLVQAAALLAAAAMHIAMLPQVTPSTLSVTWVYGARYAIIACVGGLVFAEATTFGAYAIDGAQAGLSGTIWMRLWLGYLYGALTVAPVIVLSETTAWLWLRSRWCRAMAWLAALGLLAWLSFGLATDHHGDDLLLSAPLILVSWAAIGFNRLGVALGIVLVSALMRVVTAHGYGPFGDPPVDSGEAIVQMRLFLLAATILGWIIVGMAERQAFTNRDKLVRDEALSAVSEGVLITDAAHRIIYGNSGFERMTGYRLDEVVGRDSDFLNGVDSDPAVLAAMHRCLDSVQPFSGDILNYRKDGSSFWNALSIAPIRDETGKPIRFVGILRDVSEKVTSRRELAQALQSARAALENVRLSEARYAAILDSAMVGIISVDGLGKIIAYNREAETLFGYPAIDVMGQSLDRFMPIDAARRHRNWMRDFAAAADSRRSMSDWRQVHGVRRDGSIFPMMAVISKVEIEHSLTMTVIFRDMTEIVAREDALRELATEKAVEAEKAQAANIAKSHFLANMSHELRTPLNAIIGFSELISRQQLGPIEKVAYVEFAEDIRRSGLHLLELISQILDLSRIEAGKYDLRFQPVNLGLAVEDATGRMRSRAMEAGIELIHDPVDPGLSAWGDEQAINEILAQLLSNALKFTPRGGHVTLRVMEVPAASDSATPATADWIEISVSDDGRGIPADRLNDVVRPFEQVADSYSRDVGGTGMGLAICRALAKALQGELRLESVVTKGTTARLRLPARRLRPDDTATAEPG